MEKPHVVNLRLEFLKSYMANEERGPLKKPYVFIDETWVFTNGSVRKSWQDNDIRSVKSDKGDGARYIVLHAGTEKGFVQGASLIFKSGNSKGDYHGEMNSDNFERWLTNDLLPALKESSILVMDNASYHSRQKDKLPTKSSNKAVMKAFLTQRNIAFNETATKDSLWALISQLPVASKTFVANLLIEGAGHEVLRLPPYHCQFNAIEMAWSEAKRFYDKDVLRNRNVLDTWERAMNSIIEA